MKRNNRAELADAEALPLRSHKRFHGGADVAAPDVEFAALAANLSDADFAALVRGEPASVDPPAPPGATPAARPAPFTAPSPSASAGPRTAANFLMI